MITGYNQDVQHNGRVYHVQTEDRGVKRALIETLVYTKGEILTSRRSTYEEIVKDGDVDEKAVQERLEAQHRRMVLDIKQGKFDPPEEQQKQFGENLVTSRSLDQVILDYLMSEQEKEQLDVVFLEDPSFKAKQSSEVKLKTRTKVSQVPIPEASVVVKFISTVEKPRVLFAGKSGKDGVLVISVEVPAINEGTAAVIVQVSSEQGNCEHKFLVAR